MASQGPIRTAIEPCKDPKDPSEIQLASNAEDDPRYIHPIHPLISLVSGEEADHVSWTDA